MSNSNMEEEENFDNKQDISEDNKSINSSKSNSKSNNKHNLINKKRERVHSRSIENEKTPNTETLKTKINSIINERNQNQIEMPPLNGDLISLSVFNELQPNILDQETIDQAYAKYKEKFESRKYNNFYQEHQNDEWFKEKYDPESYLKWKNERDLQASKYYQQFLDCYKDIAKKIKLEFNEEEEYNKNIKIILYTYNKEKNDFDEQERDLSKINSDKEIKELDIFNEPYFGFDPDKLTLFIRHLPKNISRWQILEVVKKVPGFVSLSLSEPIKAQDYCRLGWVSYENKEKCEEALELLKDSAITKEFKIFPMKSKSTLQKKIRLTPPLFDDRTKEDLNYTKDIIKIFDSDKGLTTILFNESIPPLDPQSQLDIQILYLRRVHGFCYYCLKEFEDERNLSKNCGNAHLRCAKRIGLKASADAEALKDEIEFDKFFTEKVIQFIKGGVIVPSPKNVTTDTNEELNEERKEFCQSRTEMINPRRHKCRICEKMFKGENFVHNHILNKHMREVVNHVDKKYFDKIKKENFLNDSKRFFGLFRMITTMEEYSNPKKHEQKSKDAIGKGNSSFKEGSTRDFQDRKKRYNFREYKDLDDPESKQVKTKMSDFSYDDL